LSPVFTFINIICCALKKQMILLSDFVKIIDIAFEKKVTDGGK